MGIPASFAQLSRVSCREVCGAVDRSEFPPGIAGIACMAIEECHRGMTVVHRYTAVLHWMSDQLCAGT